MDYERLFQNPPRRPRTIRALGEGGGSLRTVLLLGSLVVLAAVARTLLQVWFDQTWFNAVGFGDVYLTTLRASLLVGLAVATAAAVLFAIPWGAALRKTRPPLISSWWGWLVPSVVIGAFFGLAATSNVRDVLVALQHPSFGVPDPVFGQDVSFYVFLLPVYVLVHDWLVTVVICALVAVAVLAVAYAGQVTAESGPSELLAAVRFNPLFPHLSVLAGVGLLLMAANLWFDTYALVYSPRGAVFGASAADVGAQVPVNVVLGAATTLAALGLVVNARRPSLWPLAVAAVVWVGGGLVVGTILPNLFESLIVRPDQLSRETPYIQQNIAMTRKAYNLDSIPVGEFSAAAPLNQATLITDAAALSDLRIWDWRPLTDTYRQIQRFQQYYEFDDVDVDRYNLSTGPREVMLGVRELDFASLPAVAHTWQNQHLVYTHGYGVAMNPTSEIDAQGLPPLLIGDIPPRSSDPVLALSRPQIYYGRRTPTYAIVHTRLPEFDYPAKDGASEVTTSYTGPGGIAVGGGIRRLGLAIALGDLNLLLASSVDDNSQILLRRNLQERISLLAPFLRLDRDPYAVVLDGRVLWVQDAYTTTDKYPDSTPYGDLNYLRNSVKATLDAATGEVHFYVADAQEPILAAYRAVYPSLFTPIDQAPAGLEAHWRYPEDLFTAQATLLATYHMTEPRTFFNREDLWSVAKETFGDKVQQMPPFYVKVRLQGETKPEFALILPFTPAGANRQNMVAWMVARMDPGHYGEVLVYRFPSGQQVFGPQQIEARINQNPQISSALTLWSRQGSQVVRGNLLVLPLEQTLLYLQPLYIQAQQNPMPQLQRIIAASSTNVVMSDTLDGALQALSKGQNGEVLVQPGARLASGGPVVGSGTQPPVGTAPAGQPPVGNETPAQRALRAYNDAQTALRNGDWAAYGEQMRTVQQVLQQLSGQ